MAATAPQWHAAEAEDTQSNAEAFHDASDSHDGAVQVENTQYQEYAGKSSIPTKTGEEAVAETQYDDERPRTSGTSHSARTEFDDTEDGQFLASVTAKKAVDQLGDQAEGAGLPHVTSTFLARPDSEGDVTTSSDFSFAKVERPQWDLRGTRKGQAVPIKPVFEQAVAFDRRDREAETDTVSQQHQTGQDADNNLAEEAVEQPRQPSDQGKAKKRTKRKKQYDTAPTEPVQQHAVVESAPEPEASLGDLHDHVEMAVEADVTDALHTVPEYPNESSLGTPEQQMVDADVDAPASSPHTQLYDDLRAATFRQAQALDYQDQQTGHEPEELDQRYVYDADGLPTPAVMDSYQEPFHAGTPQEAYAENAHSSHRQTASRSATDRVSKRKSKVSRRSAAPAPAEALHRDQSTSDLDDYAQILLYKAHEKGQKLKIKYAAEREALRAELQEIAGAKRALQEEFDAVLEQKTDIAASLDQQRKKVSAYKTKMNRLKTFVDGLGNDIDSLKKEANLTRRKGEKLAEEGEERKAEQVALFQQLSECTDKIVSVKDRALHACQNMQSQLQAAGFRNEYLESQLDERSGLLAEERDRRSQLERQLVNSHPDDEVLRTLKCNNEAVLDKLYEIQAEIEEAQRTNKAAEMIEQTLAAIQGLTTQHSSNADDIASVKAMVESLSESVSGFFDSTEARGTEQSTLTSLQASLEDSFNGLKADLDRREQLQQQETTSREQMNALQDKVKASDIRFNDLHAQLTAVQEREADLKDQNTSLQTRVNALQSDLPPGDSASIQLSEFKTALDAKTRELEASKLQLNEKAEDVRNLSATNAHLQEQLKALQQRLEHADTQISGQRTEFERHLESMHDEVRKELEVHSDEVIADYKMRKDNKLAQLTHDCDEARSNLAMMQEKVAAAKSKMEELQKHAATIKAEKERQVHDLKKQAQSYKQQAETLQNRLSGLEAGAKGDKALKEQYNTVSAQHAETKAKYEKAVEDNDMLGNQVDELQHALTAAQAAEEATKGLLQKQQNEGHAALEEANRQLAGAKQALKRSEAGAQHLKETCDHQLETEMEKGEKQVQALQNRLGEVQRELQTQAKKNEKYVAEVEESWQTEQQDNRRAVATLKESLTQAESQRDQFLAEAERLRKEIEDLTSLQKESQHVPQQLSSSGATHISASRLRVPTLGEGITPTASNQENEPPRPRKKVDRNAGNVIEPGPVPAPEMLRPGSRTNSRAKSTEGPGRDPVIEETQFRDVTYDLLPPVAHMSQASHQSVPLGTFSDSDDMLDTASMSLARSQLPQTVPETQWDDKLPSFAAFNDSMASTHSGRPRPPSSAFFVPSFGAAAPSQSGKTSTNAPFEAKPPAAEDSFVIYEDTQQQNSQQSLHSTQDLTSARQPLQGTLTWTGAEMDKYTYRRPTPAPNSASRMIHREKDDGGSKRRHSNQAFDAQRHGDGRGSAGSQVSLLQQTAYSSSPDFVNDVAGARKISTYHTPGGDSDSKRRLSRNNSIPTADPRLLKRETAPAAPAAPAPKRKRKSSEGYTITEGYEHERKKRKQATSQAQEVMPTPNRSRYSLRGSAQTTQPSIHDLPRMPDYSQGNRSSGSQYGSQARGSQSNSQQSRVRTFGGTAARVGGVRGGRKLGKTDEINARFNQELGR